MTTTRLPVHRNPPTTKPRMIVLKHTILATTLLACVSARAGSAPPPPSETKQSSPATGILLGKISGDTTFDRAWSAFTLYKNDNNPILREFGLQGRFLLQSADGHSATREYHDAGKGDFWGNHIEVRGLHLGFRSKWFENWKLQGQIVLNGDARDDADDSTLYNEIFEAYATYALSDAFNVSAGKVRVKFSREQEISIRETLTIERSLVSNLLYPGQLTGLWADGSGIGGHWKYHLGAYGNDRVREFSSLDAGAIILGKIGYDYSALAGLDSAVASLHYMHNTDPGLPKTTTPSWAGGGTPGFTDSIALSNDLTQGRFGLTTDILYAFGDANINQSDVFAISIIPSFFITEKLQLAGRIQLAASSGDNGLTLPGRYERYSTESSDPTGDSYLSGYLGLNYYIYGHKLKLMTGLEYSTLGGGDYDGLTCFSGLRMSF